MQKSYAKCFLFIANLDSLARFSRLVLSSHRDVHTIYPSIYRAFIALDGNKSVIVELQQSKDKVFVYGIFEGNWEL